MSATALDLQSRLDDILNRRPAVGLAVGIVRDGVMSSFAAHGLADIATKRPIEADTVFRIASITKTFTAVAAMQLWEQGLVDLDTPANSYLRSFQLVAPKASWRDATLRDLLTHTAGVPKLVHPSQALFSGWFGESVALDQPIPPLGEFYGPQLRLAAEPGTTFNYSDHSLAAVGQIVEDITGETLDGYFRRCIFDPLGMDDSDLLRSPRFAGRLATGYKLGRHGPTAVTDRNWVTPAASLIYSTPADMARYVAMLLGGGAGVHGTVLKPETVALMFAPHYQPDPSIPGIGLGFFRDEIGGHAVIEHQGILPGFNGQLYLAPGAGVGVLGFTNGARNAVVWLAAEMARLLGDLLGAEPDEVRPDVPHHPELWGELCGWYRPIAQRSDTQVLGLVGAGAQVRVRRGQLTLRALSPLPAVFRGFVLHPDDPADPYVFRVDLRPYDLGTARIVFSRHAGRTRLHLGGLVPITAQKHGGPNPHEPTTGELPHTAATALVREESP